MAKLAVVRVRGAIRTKPAVKKTFQQLKLLKKNQCIILEDTPVNKGMINAVRSFVAWGEVGDDTIKMLDKRKKKNSYSLLPPKKGFESKSTKVAFNAGGALGYRGDKIKLLLERMI